MTTIFGKIIRGELPAEVVFENDQLIAIQDIHPVAPVHILLIPKKEICDFQSLAPADYPLLQEIAATAQRLALQFGVEEGYRLLTNCGSEAGQTIDHLHFHLIGGRRLGPMA